MNTTQTLLLMAGTVVAVAGNGSATTDSPDSAVMKHSVSPAVTSCQCDCEGQLAALESRVAELEIAEVATVAPVVDPPVEVVESSPLASIADSYTGGIWSHPGSVDEHLVSDHNVLPRELTGLSHEQKERLHSSLHEGGQSHVVTQPTRTYSSGCPGGVCPVNRSTSVRSYSSQRKGLFGGGGLFGRRNR